ncbi:hypothetical protein [Burkholderia multivorans]|uniref:hypothetical protein n=1 Tax=Burkholderia multivorans TaxID=87883 RepID=UPI001F3F24C1|nr:hypothetical protein [Burkholderia multivorans]
MARDLNPFTHMSKQRATIDETHEGVTGSSCRWGWRGDIEPDVHRFQFVTLAFDKPQTVFRLPQWRWPVIGPYNGFSGAARIRGWQLVRFYQRNGWLHYDDVCSVTGNAGGTGLHNEDYSRPWNALPVSKRSHTLIHTRARFPKTWAIFLANEALSDTWATTLSPDGGVSVADRDCGVVQLLDHAPHPPWVVVPENEFDRR